MSKHSSFSSFINRCLKKMDYFAVTFQFRVNNYKKYGSATGGIIFSMFLILSVSYFINRFLDYITWTDTRLQFIEKSPEQSPILNLKDFEFEYAISINFENETSIFGTQLKDLFEIEHRYIVSNNTINTTSSLSKIITKPRNCNNEDFLDKIDSSNIFHENKYSYKCFDVNETYNLGGRYTDKIFSYIEIFLKINKKYFQNYTNLEQIFKENQFKFTIYFLDNLINVGKIYNLTSIKIEAIYTYINFHNYERNNIFLKEIELCTDENLLYKAFKCKEFQKFSRFENKMAPFPNRNALPEDSKFNINKFILRIESSKSQINVSFMKLSDFLSTVLALLVNVLVILNAIFIPFNEIKARQGINQKIMNVKDVIKTENKSLLEYFTDSYKKNIAFNYEYKLINDGEKLKKSNFIINEITNSNNNVKNQNNLIEKISSLQKSVEMELKNELNDISNIQNSTYLNLQRVENVNLNNKLDQAFDLCKIDLNSEKKRDINFNRSNYSNNTNIRDFMFNNNSQGLKCEEDTNRTNINKNIKINEFSHINNNLNNNIIKKKKKDIQHLYIENEHNLENKLGKNFKIESSIKSKNPFKIRLKDIIKYIFKCNDIKSKLEINTIAEKKFNQNIDIINYMTIIHEVDILKYLILDGDTIDIMDFLSKPKILKNNDNKKYDYVYEKFFEYNIYEKSKKASITNLENTFDKIMSNENPNIFSLKLMKIFEQQIQSLLE